MFLGQDEGRDYEENEIRPWGLAKPPQHPTTLVPPSTAPTSGAGTGEGGGDTGGQRMTRTQTLQKQIASSSTIFNMYTLHHINELLDAIDEARAARDKALLSSAPTALVGRDSGIGSGMGGESAGGPLLKDEYGALTSTSTKFNLSSHANRYCLHLAIYIYHIVTGMD